MWGGKNKLLLGLFILIFIFFIVSYFFKKKEIEQSVNETIVEENFSNSNIIKDIKYVAKDLKNNEYIIEAREGEIDLNNSSVIFLKDVTAIIKMTKNNEKITIVSDFGKYNTVSFDTIFSKNIIINYLDNKITSDYLDFSMQKNLLIISKNVVYTNPDNILRADVVELDTITRDTKIFMYNSKKKLILRVEIKWQ